MTARTRTALLLCGLFALFTLHCGCGKKAWPTPQAGQDAFGFEAVEASKAEECLQVQARLSGAAQNLQSVVLILEALDEPCPGCPFQPSRSIELPLNAPQIRLQGKNLDISFCDIDPKKAYRLKLQAENIYVEIRAVQSEVVLVQEPSQEE